MIETAVIFSPIYYQHKTGRKHPESPRRLRSIMKDLQEAKASNNPSWRIIAPEKASTKDVQLVHSIDYVRLVKSICDSGGGLLDLHDTITSPQSYEVALHAVGGTLKAVNLVMQKKFKNAFALVRPPGHHASRFRGLGFCIFNNIAIAAQHLLRHYKLDKIIILDIDAHHGNGTQETFYRNNNILFISLHEDPSIFPGTGFVHEAGKGKGLGYNINIPLPFGTGDRVYLKAINEIVVPIARQYKPEFILVSAGFDGHHSDPVANLSLSTVCYQRIYETILDMASENCEGKLVAVLEGGYRCKSLARLTTAMIGRMSGMGHEMKEGLPSNTQSDEKHGLRAVKEVKKVQKAFWKL